MDNKSLGKMIHIGRIDKEMSRSELAEKVGCSSAAVWQWEKGRKTPSIIMVAKIDKVLGLGILTDSFLEKAGGKS